MGSIFKTAATQAIFEILERNASKGKFGWSFNEDEINAATEELCSFFEMGINLRNATQQRFTPTPSVAGEEKGGSPVPSMSAKGTEEHRNNNTAGGTTTPADNRFGSLGAAATLLPRRARSPLGTHERPGSIPGSSR